MFTAYKGLKAILLTCPNKRRSQYIIVLAAKRTAYINMYCFRQTQINTSKIIGVSVSKIIMLSTFIAGPKPLHSEVPNIWPFILQTTLPLTKNN